MSNHEPAGTPPSFWNRQFQDELSFPRMLFDGAFGVLLPPACLIAVTIVFKLGYPPVGPLFERYAVYAYAFFGLSMIALLAAMFTRPPNAFLAGWLFVSAFFALSVGILILPYSLVGLFFAVGAFGFTPFFTAFAHERNAVRMMRGAWRGSRFPAAAALLGAAMAGAVPLYAHQSINQSFDMALAQLVHKDAARRSEGIERIQNFRLFFNPDRLVIMHINEDDPAKRQRLDEAYGEITGGDLDDRRMILLD